jgi:hypothetical protein
MINEIFDWCVHLLEWGAERLGTTYVAINVWIFCIIEPIVFLGMLVILIYQRRKIKQLTIVGNRNQQSVNTAE